MFNFFIFKPSTQRLIVRVSRSFCLSAIAFATMSSMAHANEAKEAERVRIVEDMKRMSRRGTWLAVEKKYQKLLDLGKDTLQPEDHMLGAQAALNLGKIESTCVRIQRTLDAIERLQDGEKYAQLKIDAENWLTQLRTTFVPVNISINRTYKGDTELKIGQLPFLPEENDALKRAQKMLAANGEYRGMLPLGEYTIGDVSFTLESEQVDIRSPLSDQRKFIKVPEPTQIVLSPRINLSGALSSSNRITNEKDLNAIAFEGFGFKTSAGVDVSFGKNIHLFTEVGMHQFGKQVAIPDKYSETLGIQPTDTSYKGYFLWLGGQFDLAKLAISTGPTIERATISTQGAANIKSSLPEDRQYLTDYVPMSGTVLSAGLTSAVTYHIKKVGSNQIGVSALATVSNDSARWYSSYQLALTYAP